MTARLAATDGEASATIGAENRVTKNQKTLAKLRLDSAIATLAGSVFISGRKHRGSGSLTTGYDSDVTLPGPLTTQADVSTHLAASAAISV